MSWADSQKLLNKHYMCLYTHLSLYNLLKYICQPGKQKKAKKELHHEDELLMSFFQSFSLLMQVSSTKA